HDAALAFEAKGRFREAIDAWTLLNRAHPDTEVEQRLVRLRHEAALQLDASVPVGPWPRPLADPFPNVCGLPPEILGDELTSEVLGGAILHHGCVLVRELVAAARAESQTERGNRLRLAASTLQAHRRARTEPRSRDPRRPFRRTAGPQR